MPSQKITFTNQAGLTLDARVDLPADQHPFAFALFAHCFTCNKNFSAVRNITRSLNQNGIGVMRFDFTGLGQSDGDFSETSFSTNKSDLLDAANFLAKEYMAPALLIGHSLGGAAVLSVAGDIASVKAVATVGAPSDLQHVTHLMTKEQHTIESEGEAEVNIGGRLFRIKNQFLQDLQNHHLKACLSKLRKAVLIMHSPQDTIVSIDNAAILFGYAHHPKSFISLDGADHMLSNKNDSLYVGNVIATWVSRYVYRKEKEQLESDHGVVARITKESNLTVEVQAGTHALIADEPVEVGGKDLGPSPYELVGAGLAACTAMTMKMYADRKEWPLEEVLVHVEYERKHAHDSSNPDEAQKRLEAFNKYIEIKGDLDEKQKDRLLDIAGKCPVHKTLTGDLHIHSFLGNGYKTNKK